MQIWVDGDACPAPVKQILFRASERTRTKLVLVANHLSKIPASDYISIIVVGTGIDEADNYITSYVNQGDLVITADIPLASHAVSKGCLVLNPRGMLYNEANIKQQLALRNLMADLRDQNLIMGGPAKYNKVDSQLFARELDKILATTSLQVR